MRGTLPYRLDDLHKKYGPVVRVAPNELSFIEAAAWKDIYAKKEYLRPDEFRNRLPGKDSDHFITADVETHARFRRIFNPAFSEKALREQEPTVQSYIGKMMNRCEEAIDNTATMGILNVTDLFNFVTFDIIGDLGWGKDFRCLTTMQYHPWIRVVLSFQVTMIVASLKYYPWLDRIVQTITPASAMEPLKLITATAEKNVADRLALDNDRPDIMSFAIKHNATTNDSSSRISKEELETNSMVLIVGGSETTATALAGTINCLLQSPQVLQTLLKEIRESFAHEKEITYLSTQSLPYLRAVIDEGLRMCPPLPDIMRRVVSEGDAVIAGHPVASQTVVGIALWPSMHSRENFVKPDEFRPERWLSSSEGSLAEFASDRKAAFQPFSAGPSGCLGQNLAKMELRIILARFLWRFDIRLPDGTKPLQWNTQKIWWSWSKDPLNVQLSRRK